MTDYRLSDWIPTTKKEVELRGWDELDVILFSGDAYVDHPSFGCAVIARTWRHRAYVSQLFRNLTGMVISVTLKSWGRPSCSLV